MAKLQKQVSRKVGDKEYVKYVAVIPSKIVKDAKLKEGDELTISSNKNKIVLSKNNKKVFKD